MSHAKVLAENCSVHIHYFLLVSLQFGHPHATRRSRLAGVPSSLTAESSEYFVSAAGSTKMVSPFENDATALDLSTTVHCVTTPEPGFWTRRKHQNIHRSVDEEETKLNSYIDLRKIRQWIVSKSDI